MVCLEPRYKLYISTITKNFVFFSIANVISLFYSEVCSRFMSSHSLFCLKSKFSKFVIYTRWGIEVKYHKFLLRVLHKFVNPKG